MNIYLTNTRALSSAKETLVKFNLYIEPHKLIVGDFNIPLSSIDRSFRQKLNREIMELTDVINPMDLTDIYSTFYPNTKEYTFFSAPHRTFSKIDHSYKASLNRYK
jgi:exonuclease III